MAQERNSPYPFGYTARMKERTARLEAEAAEKAALDPAALAVHDQLVAQATVDAIDWQGRDQAVADAVSAHYLKRARKAAKARAVEPVARVTPAPQKAATVDPEPMEVVVPHRDADGKIAYITRHKVTDPDDIEDLVDA